MKIVFLIQDITTAGGTERTTCCLATELVRQGQDVTIVSVFRNEAEPRYTAEGVKICYLTNMHYGLEDGKAGRLRKAFGQCSNVRSCRELQEADIIICQKILATMLAYMAGLGHKAVACEHFKYALYSAPLRWLRHRLYRRMCAVVTLTEKDRAVFLREGLRYVYCIPNMVSVSPLPYCGQDSKRIVSVGRLTPQKGYDLLLKAVAYIADRLNGWQIDIYGEGKDRQILEQQREQLGLTDIVHFRGYRRNIEQVYASSALYVMSSRFEGFPMVLIEAAACGLPIISFDCPEGPAILLHDGGGLLVPAEDTQALGATILRLTGDDTLREQCHRETAAVIAPYKPKHIGTQWLQLLQQLTQHTP